MKYIIKFSRLLPVVVVVFFVFYFLFFLQSTVTWDTGQRPVLKLKMKTWRKMEEVPVWNLEGLIPQAQ